MLTVIGMLLRIVLWILLIVLGLGVFLLLLALFTPIPYRIRLNGDPEQTPAFTVCVRVFGLQIYPKKERKYRRLRKDRTKASEARADNEPEKVPDKPDIPEQQAPAVIGSEQARSDNEPEQTKNIKNTKKSKRSERSGHAWREGFQRLRSELTDEGNKRALQHMLREISVIIRHFGPRQVRADAVFSLGDPANTGYATAVLAICPFAYGRHTVLTPDFMSERMYFKGWAELHGHVRLIHAVCAGVRLLTDRNIRRILRKLWK